MEMGPSIKWTILIERDLLFSLAQVLGLLAKKWLPIWSFHLLDNP
jgi:hypothetical protein